MRTPTFIQYPCDGMTREFSVPFPYLTQAHVSVKAGLFQLSNGAHYDFTGTGTIQIRPQFTPSAGTILEVRRVTDYSAALAVFQDGANLPAEDLNTAVRQLLYVIQELNDGYAAVLENGRVTLPTGEVRTTTELVDYLLGRIAESDVLGRLQQRLADIDTNAVTIVANTSAIRSLEEAIQTLGMVNAEGIATVIQNEASARIMGDTALAQQLSLIGAVNAGNSAFVLNLDTVQVSPTESLATRLSGISAAFGNANAAIATESSARAAADSAIASTVTALQSRVGTAEAAISTESTTRATADTATAAQITALTSRVGTAEAGILSEATTRATADSAMATTIAGLTSRVGAAEAGIVTEANTRATADSATATQLSTLTARVGTAESAIQTERSVRADADSAFAQQFNGLVSRVGTAEAGIASEATTRATADSALTTSVNALFSRVGAAEAAITTEATTRATADSAMTSVVNAQISRIDGALAGIASEATTRANADSAITSSVNALFSRVGSAEAAITLEQQTRATADSAAASSVAQLSATVNGQSSTIQTIQSVQAGLTAQYSVKLDVNGRVVGFGLYNNGATSDFIVTADSFQVVAPGANQQSVAPFSIINGVVYMQNVVIRDANIENLTVGKLTSGTLSADINVGAGRVVYQNNGFMRVQGIGFGSSNQFIDWYGPVQASYSACTEANAVFYLSGSGRAYFGGGFKTGNTRYMATQARTNALAQADIPAFTSNGGAVTVSMEYGLDAGLINGSTARIYFSGSTTVVLSRSLNGGPFVDVSTVTFTTPYYLANSATPTVSGSTVGPGVRVDWRGTGTFSYADPDASAVPRAYRARITSRTGFDPAATFTAQPLTIIATE